MTTLKFPFSSLVLFLELQAFIIVYPALTAHFLND